MSTQPFYNPKFRALDSNGNPLSGGLLYTYSAGTTTPLSTYADSTGGVTNANPVVLDAHGEADVWLTPGVNYKFTLKDSASVVQWTVDNVPSPKQPSASTDVSGTDPGGRLTLTSAAPVTTGDVTGATTIYYAPYRSDKVPLYDGAAWALYSIGSSGLAQTTGDSTKSPAPVANNSNYDLFVWNDSGVVRLSRGPAWASSLARGTGAATTELQQLNGRWVNKYSISNGPAAQIGLYVGTVRSDGSAQLNDSMTTRNVWNNYNRVSRPMLRTETTATWVYTSTTVRQANGSAANQLNFVRGFDEECVRCHVLGVASVVSDKPAVGVGLDSTTTFDSANVLGLPTLPAGTDGECIPEARWIGLPGIGVHSLMWLEATASTNATVNWYGFFVAANVTRRSGISAEFLA